MWRAGADKDLGGKRLSVAQAQNPLSSILFYFSIKVNPRSALNMWSRAPRIHWNFAGDSDKIWVGGVGLVSVQMRKVLSFEYRKSRQLPAPVFNLG